MMVSNLPVEQQIVFQQTFLLVSNLEQIAKAQSIAVNEIKDRLKITRLIISGSFAVRFDL